MKVTKAWIPNIITSVRIAGALCLWFIAPLSTAFYIVYSVCGVSDALDGFVARKTGTVSETGSKLDSVSDLVFYVVTLVRLLPIVSERLPAVFFVFVGTVLAIRLCSYGVAAVKYRRFASMHTYMNKFTGFLIFCLPYAMISGKASLLGPCSVICAIAGLASVEELAIHIISDKYNPEIKTIFQLNQK